MSQRSCCSHGYYYDDPCMKKCHRHDNGEKGQKGQKGQKGTETIGQKGDKGNNGIQGEIGSTGPKGDLGNTGDTGPQGIQGDTGDTGPKGDIGNTGPQGIQGDIGNTGPQGIQGDIGNTGPQGIQGDTGAACLCEAIIEATEDLNLIFGSLPNRSITKIIHTNVATIFKRRKRGRDIQRSNDSLLVTVSYDPLNILMIAPKDTILSGEKRVLLRDFVRMGYDLEDPDKYIALLSNNSWMPPVPANGNNISSDLMSIFLKGKSVAISYDGSTLVAGTTDLPTDAGGVIVYSINNNIATFDTFLLGTVISDPGNRGRSVSLSSDGNTLAVGCPGDNGGVGCTQIWIRIAGIWTQQDTLVGTVISDPASRGFSVSLSSDGNILAVGCPNDNGGEGSTQIFNRTGVIWTYITTLVGGVIGGNPPNRGYSVSLSADGTFLAVGCPSDNSGNGCTQIFFFDGVLWTQNDTVVGPSAIQPSNQGSSVSLCADGNVLAIGGPVDNSGIGATWIYLLGFGNQWSFVRKIVGVTDTPSPNQGTSVSLSSNGQTVAICGPTDGFTGGAGWVFSQTFDLPLQPAVPADIRVAGSGPYAEGSAVSLSGDGSIMAIGDIAYLSGEGAVWLYA